MVEPVSLQTILTYLTLISVPVGVFYHILTLRNQSRAREVQITLQITNNFNVFSEQWSKFMYTWQWTDFNDFWTKYGPEKNLDEWSSMMEFWVFIENLGVMVKRKSLGIDLVDDIFSATILDFWNKVEPIAIGLRELWNMPDVMIWTEHLADELRKIREKRWTQQTP